MTGLIVGLAFLSSFGLGAMAIVAWLGLAVVLRARRGLSNAAFLAVIVATIGGALWAHSAVATPKAPQAGSFEGTAIVRDGPFLTQNGQRFVVSGETVGGSRVCVYAGGEPQPHAGDQVFLVGRITLPYDLPAGGAAALAARDCQAQLRAETLRIVASGSGVLATLSRARTHLSDFLMQSEPGDTGALLSGLVTGEDGGLSGSASDAFLQSGTTHITAISGANFTTLTLLLGVMVAGSLKRSTWFVVIAAGVIWTYAVMVGLQPSAFRAALLATAILAGRWLGRIPDLLTLTFLLASVQILLRPHDFHTLAFQLSLAATVALIVVFDGIGRRSDRNWPETVLFAVLAAQLATIPILAARLGTMTGIGLVANLVVGPLASGAFPIALVASLIGLVSPWIGEIAMLPAIWLSDAILWFVTAIDQRLPGQVQLGAPVPAANALIAFICWGMIFAMSGDLRRWGRHAVRHARDW